MPPKSKLHKSTGKPKSLPKREINEDTPELQLSPEAAQQFELELCWCIQQVQSALKSGKLNAKQSKIYDSNIYYMPCISFIIFLVQDHTKALNVLMSNSTSLVRKRQVMRLSFGDYRAKMAEQEKKLKTSGMKRCRISNFRNLLLCIFQQIRSKYHKRTLAKNLCF